MNIKRPLAIHQSNKVIRKSILEWCIIEHLSETFELHLNWILVLSLLFHFLFHLVSIGPFHLNHIYFFRHQVLKHNMDNAVSFDKSLLHILEGKKLFAFFLENYWKFQIEKFVEKMRSALYWVSRLDWSGKMSQKSETLKRKMENVVLNDFYTTFYVLKCWINQILPSK